MRLLRWLYDYAKAHSLEKEAFFEEMEIEWLLKVGLDGVSIERLHGPRGNRGQPMHVPIPLKRSSGLCANIPADNAMYVLGMEFPPEEGKRPRSDPDWHKKCHEDYVAQLERAALETGDIGIQIVAQVLRQKGGKILKESSIKNAEIESGDMICPAVFENGVWQPLVERPSLRKWWVEKYPELQKMEIGEGQCQVTGKISKLARIHPLVRGVRGGRSTGVTLVTFNDPSSESFGKTQGANAPISVEAAILCSKAFSRIISSQSGKRRAVEIRGEKDETVYMGFVARRKEEEAAADFVLSLLDPVETDFEADQGFAGKEVKVWKSYRSLFGGPHQGVLPPPQQTPVDMFVAALRANSSRIEIRREESFTFGEIRANVDRYFQDLAIIDPFKKEVRSDFPLRSIWPKKDPKVKAKGPVARGLMDALRNKNNGDMPDPKVLTGMYLAAITGAPFPVEIVRHSLDAISRNAKDSSYGAVPTECAALLKAWLKRDLRRQDSPLFARFIKLDPNFGGITEMLDPKCAIPAYVLGRYLAVAESVQEAAIPGVNASVVKRLFDGVSRTPANFMPGIMRDMNHHFGKLSRVKRGYVIWAQRLVGEILGLLSPELNKSFPKSLDFQEQSLFSLGYFHQRTWLFTKRSDESEEGGKKETA